MRLRRSELDRPGLSRRRRGGGFSYLQPGGGPAAEADVERIRTLAIPPAWREVWICPWSNGHIQATGIDDAGRRQYLYHSEWRRQRDEQKYDRVLELAPSLGDFRRTVQRQLTGRGWPRNRTLAVALRMLDHGVFRTGGDEYAELNGTYGVATLRREHVHISGTKITFAYPAKGGLDRNMTLVDGPLARALQGLKRVRSDADRLLVYRVGQQLHRVHAEDVNDRFKALVGDQYAVKDLRTWNATVLAAAALAGQPDARSGRAARRAEMTVLRQVAEQLGNTPAVARKSYVDPRLFDLYEHGVTIRPALEEIGSDDLQAPAVRGRVEKAVFELLAD